MDLAWDVCWHIRCFLDWIDWDGRDLLENKRIFKRIKTLR